MHYEEGWIMDDRYLHRLRAYEDIVLTALKEVYPEKLTDFKPRQLDDIFPH